MKNENQNYSTHCTFVQCTHRAIALSPEEDSIYVLGGSNAESELIFDNSTHQFENAGLTDAVIFSFSEENGTLNWGTFYGGDSFERDLDLSVTNNGLIILTGSTRSSSGISTPNALITSISAGARDCFISAFNQSGQQLWGTYLGSDSQGSLFPYLSVQDEYILLSISTTSNSLHVTGENPFVPQIGEVSTGSFAGYIAKIDTDGNFIWSTYSNPDYECSYCSIVAASGNESFACMGGFPDDSNNQECLDNLSSDAYQTEYGGGFTDMAFYFYNDNTLSVAGQEFEPLTIYPNPSNDFVTIEIPQMPQAGMELSITDLSGRQVDEIRNFRSGNTYDINHLAEGVYILSGRMGERMFREKLVISR